MPVFLPSQEENSLELGWGRRHQSHGICDGAGPGAPVLGMGLLLPKVSRGWAQEEGACQLEHQVDVGCPHHTPTL